MKIANDRSCFYQWELNQKLELDIDCGEVHFENGTLPDGLVVEVKEENGVRVCDVPNILLQTATLLHAFAWDTEKTHVVAYAVFNVLPKQKPSDYAYTETEVITVNKAVKKAMKAAEEALASSQRAENAADLATQAAENADQAALAANQAAADADSSAQRAGNAADLATQAAENADQAALAANQAAAEVNESAQNADNAANLATQAAGKVDQATLAAKQATKAATDSAEKADSATNRATQAAENADKATLEANQAAQDAHSAAQKAVRYDTEQDFSDEQKEQARKNIGLDEDVIFEMLVVLELAPVLLDADGAVFTDGDGVILKNQ